MRRRVIALAIALAARGAYADSGEGLAADIGFAGGGDWTPGGLHLDVAYLTSLSAQDWFDIGVGFTLGGSSPGCFGDRAGSYTCAHGVASGESIGFGAGVRHYLGEAAPLRPFLRGGVGVAFVRYPNDVVLTKTGSTDGLSPTVGMNGVAVTAHVGGGVRVETSSDVALTAAVDLIGGGGGFAGSSNAQTQIGFAITAGAELSLDSPRAAPKHRAGNPWSLVGVAAVYAPFVTWEYYAWYNGAHHIPVYFDTAWSDEKLGLHTYAGGADKLGHMYIHYVLTRGTTNILTAGGWDRWAASLISFSVDQLEATFSEMKDGPVWGYEVGDTIANFSGAALAVLMENVPTIDRLFDFRLEYWPSHAYIQLAKQHPFSRGDGLDISQDYTGQSYMLAMHLGALPYDHDTPALLWTNYADLVVGFETRHYEPAEMPVQVHRQTQYIGVAVNMQAVLESLFKPSRGRTVGRGIAEVYSLPYTTLHLADYNRYWDPSGNTKPL